MKHEKSRARIAVETVLQQHTSLTNPLGAKRISELSGVDLYLTRYYLGRFMGMLLISNTGSRGTSAYYWNAAVPREIPQSVSRISPLPYTGERALPLRAGAMQAFEIPSLSPTGERIPRRAPCLMGASLA